MVVINNKTLYLVLKRFEEMGGVTRQIIQQTGKPNRHLYALTDHGIKVLQALLRDFGPEQAGSDAEFFTRVSFFDFLEVEARMAILRQRLYKSRLSQVRTIQVGVTQIRPTQIGKAENNVL